MQINIKRFDTNFPLPDYEEGGACFDLTCRETVVIQPHEIKAVPQNIALEVPAGHALLLFSRSSTPLRKGLTLANGVGVVDPFYSGDNDENLAFFLNVTDKPVTVNAGDKLVHGMIIKTEPIEWNEVESLDNEGHGGYRYKNEDGEITSLD